MSKTYLYQTFAQTYGSGSYDTSAYGSGTTVTQGSAGSQSGGALTNTGIAVLGIVTLAAVIVLIAMVVRIWKRPVRQVVTQEAEVSSQETNQ